MNIRIIFRGGICVHQFFWCYDFYSNNSEVFHTYDHVMIMLWSSYDHLMLIICSSYAHHMLIVCSLYAHCMLIVCSLYAHCLLIAWSFYDYLIQFCKRHSRIHKPVHFWKLNIQPRYPSTRNRTRPTLCPKNIPLPNGV